jgi:hypothetical protein
VREKGGNAGVGDRNGGELDNKGGKETAVLQKIGRGGRRERALVRAEEDLKLV